MSKSEDSPQGTILVLDPPKTIEKKIKSAVTDSGSEVRHDRDEKPGVSNLIEIYGAVTGADDRRRRARVRRRAVRRVQGRGRRSGRRIPAAGAGPLRRARRRPRARSTAASRSAPTPPKRSPNPCSPARHAPRPACSPRASSDRAPLADCASSRARVGEIGRAVVLAVQLAEVLAREQEPARGPAAGAPWITTACEPHHSTLTPTPMPTAGEVRFAHLRVRAGRRVLRVEVASRLGDVGIGAHLGDVAAHVARSSRSPCPTRPRVAATPSRSSPEPDEQQDDEDAACRSLAAACGAGAAAAPTTPGPPGPTGARAVGPCGAVRLAVEAHEVGIGRSVPHVRCIGANRAGVHRGTGSPSAAARISQISGGIPVPATAPAGGARRPRPRPRGGPRPAEPVGAQLVVVHVPPDRARQARARRRPATVATTVAADRPTAPSPVSALPTSWSSAAATHRRIGVGAERAAPPPAPSRPTRPGRRARGVPSTRARRGCSVPRTNSRSAASSGRARSDPTNRRDEMPDAGVIGRRTGTRWSRNGWNSRPRMCVADHEQEQHEDAVRPEPVPPRQPRLRAAPAR